MPYWVANILTSRGLSLVVASIYLGVTIYFAPHDMLVASLLKVGSGLLFPLVCIWFADEMGDYVGTLPGPAITRTTPGWMVELGGWILLLLPVIIYCFIILVS